MDRTDKPTKSDKSSSRKRPRKAHKEAHKEAVERERAQVSEWW